MSYDDPAEEDALPRVPNLRLADLKFTLGLEKYSGDPKLIAEAWELIKKSDMAPFYETFCRDLKIAVDESELRKMKARNTEELKKLDAAITVAEESLSSEIRQAVFAKAAYLAKIGEKDEAVSTFRKTCEDPSTIGQKLDAIFYILRIGLFYLDFDLLGRNIDKAKNLIDQGGDWDRRNRLKVYEGLYLVSVREFKRAADLFLDALPTFTSYELVAFDRFVVYSVVLAMVSLPRPSLRKKVINGADVQEVLYALPVAKEFLFAFFECRYASFFKHLAHLEQWMKQDRFFSPHYRFYIREMKLNAYKQLLESYRSLALPYMAREFGVSEGFIDGELSKLIAARRIFCKIDRVNGIVETTHPDSKNFRYQQVIKKGDVLLNRIQKLSRVINI